MRKKDNWTQIAFFGRFVAPRKCNIMSHGREVIC